MLDRTRLQSRSVTAALLVLTVLAGCSGFRFNAQMCDQIRMDPTQALPQECYDYSEEEAAKSSLPPSEREESTREGELELVR